MTRFNVWLVTGYAPVFILLSVVIVTLPSCYACLIIEDAVGDCNICADGGKSHVQAAKELTSGIVGVSGEMRPDDANVGRVPAVDDQRAEHQPNSV